jgi:hypothetical protein
VELLDSRFIKKTCGFFQQVQCKLVGGGLPGVSSFPDEQTVEVWIDGMRGAEPRTPAYQTSDRRYETSEVEYVRRLGARRDDFAIATCKTSPSTF